LRAVQSLNLALLIHTEDHRVIGWVAQKQQEKPWQDFPEQQGVGIQNADAKPGTPACNADRTSARTPTLPARGPRHE
jgi:hypothetical protein